LRQACYSFETALIAVISTLIDFIEFSEIAQDLSGKGVTASLPLAFLNRPKLPGSGSSDVDGLGHVNGRASDHRARIHQ
jgi:hypothetical protein